MLNEELRRQWPNARAEIADLLHEMSFSDAEALKTGVIFDGRYRVEKPLAAGGMGSVYEVLRT